MTENPNQNYQPSPHTDLVKRIERLENRIEVLMDHLLPENICPECRCQMDHSDKWDHDWLIVYWSCRGCGYSRTRAPEWSQYSTCK